MAVVDTGCWIGRIPVLCMVSGASPQVRGGNEKVGGVRRASLGLLAVSGFLRSYLTVVVFAGFAGLLVGAILGLSSLVRPRKPTREKVTNYESGVDPTGIGWSQSQIRYYVFALLFVMFDVEAVFIFPWAVQVDALAVFGLVEMLVFIVILALGLAYAWRKGVLRWV
jgi:NADH-quinone oxidoreductase subunit A